MSTFMARKTKIVLKIAQEGKMAQMQLDYFQNTFVEVFPVSPLSKASLLLKTLG